MDNELTEDSILDVIQHHTGINDYRRYYKIPGKIILAVMHGERPLFPVLTQKEKDKIERLLSNERAISIKAGNDSFLMTTPHSIEAVKKVCRQFLEGNEIQHHTRSVKRKVYKSDLKTIVNLMLEAAIDKDKIVLILYDLDMVTSGAVSDPNTFMKNLHK